MAKPQQIRAFPAGFGLRTAPVADLGFSLLELVVVMAIIAILALMTIPALYSKVPRAQVEESTPLAKVATDKVAGYYSAKGALPADNDTVGLPPGNKIIGNFVESVTVKDGAVTMKFRDDANPKIAGKQLTWRPAIVKDTPATPIAWVCAKRKVPDGMEAGGVDATDLPMDTIPLAPNCALRSQ